ncbi:GNAT family N-acetyltransferase [Sphingomonas xanthus]|uniref:GNAT family N-acetyltransferase n=1 Tax=Sphingomonas xanthus TaxID=2594473 RepID=UPI001C9CDA2F|nr:GNAT family N-acetyltransferase [Sphingomonas xanthus]
MIRTERLELRRWRDEDRAPFAQMGQDPEVMRHFPSLLTKTQSDAMIDERFEAHFDQHNFGFWALERRSDRCFLGFAGISKVGFQCPIEGQVEIGWRLARHAWGQGFAFEAASAAMNYGFGHLGLDRIVAMTVIGNERSRRLIAKLGMARAPEWDFDHPRVPAGSPVRPQIVYSRNR